MNALAHEETGRSAGVHPAHRGSIFLEEGMVLRTRPGRATVRAARPRAQCAARALPGSFVHLTCDPSADAPAAIDQRADAREGWIEILYKIVGQACARCRAAASAMRSACSGPIGAGVPPDPHARERCWSAAASVSRRWCSWRNGCSTRRASRGDRS